MKNFSKRTLALLLTMTMLLSCAQINVFAANTAVETVSTGGGTSANKSAVMDPNGVLGAQTILSLSTDKTEYTSNEPIIVTATGSGSAWVGLFAENSANPIYKYTIDGENNGIDHNSGMPYDIKSYGVFDESLGIPAKLNVGNYVVAVYESADATTASATKNIKITSSNVVSPTIAGYEGYSIEMEKLAFTEDEDVKIKVKVDSSASTTPFLYLYREPHESLGSVSNAKEQNMALFTEFNNITASSSLCTSKLGVGTYSIRLYADLDKWASEAAVLQFAVLPDNNDGFELKIANSYYEDFDDVEVFAKSPSDNSSSWIAVLSNDNEDSVYAFLNKDTPQNGTTFKLTDLTFLDSKNNEQNISTYLNGKGPYTVCLYSDGTYNNPVKMAYFSLNSADDGYSGTLETSAYKVNSNDDVTIKASCENPNAWLAVYEHPASRANYATSGYAINWVWLGDNNNKEVSLRELFGSKLEATWASGKSFDVVLFGNEGYVPVASVIVKVDDTNANPVAGAIDSNKSTYAYGENIYVTGFHTGIDGMGGARVALARKDYADNEYVFYSKIENYGKGQSVLLQDTLNLGTTFMESGQAANPYQISQVLTPGEYELRLLSGNGTFVTARKAITITDFDKSTYDVPELSGVAYEIENYSDGYANGTVTVKADKNAIKDISASYFCELYWGDESGNKLTDEYGEEYAKIAAFPITGEYTTEKLTKNTIIPTGAKSILAYGIVGRNLITSQDNVVYSQPVNAYFSSAIASNGKSVTVSTFDRLNGQNYVEFQSVTDTHIHDVYDLYGSNDESDVYVIGADKKDAAHFYFNKLDDYGNLTANSVVTETNHNEHWRMFLTDVVTNSSNSIGIIVNGDVADYSVSGNNKTNQSKRYGQYKNFFSELDKDSYKSLHDKVYVNMGNHDGCSYTSIDVENHNHFKAVHEFQTYPTDKSELTPQKPYYDFWIDDNGNYLENPTADAKKQANHFILLANEDDSKNLIGANQGYLSETQTNWLDELLAWDEENRPDQPTFVFMHQPLRNTVAGSQDGTATDGLCSDISRAPYGWGGVIDDADHSTGSDTRLRTVMEKYSNVIMFGGHTHYDLYSEDNIYAGSYNTPTAFNTASIGYIWDEFYKPAGEGIEGAQGYFVRVYEDGTVLVLGRDFITGKYIPAAMFAVEQYDEEEFSVPEKMELDLYSDPENNTLASATNMNVQADGLTLTYTSLNPSVATVDENGNVKPVSSGTAKIRVTANGNNTNVVTKKIVNVTVTNNIVEGVLGEPVNLGDFSAYIKSVTQDPKSTAEHPQWRYLTMPDDWANEDVNARYTHFNRKYADTTGSEVYSYDTVPVYNATTDKWENQVTNVNHTPTIDNAMNRGKVLAQFWDFELQDDGSYIIYSTQTNVSHKNSYGYNQAFALSGGGVTYDAPTYLLCEPTGDTNSLEPEERDNFLQGDRADYYKWYIYQDNNGQYYFQCKATGKFANLWTYKSGDVFINYGSLDDFTGLAEEESTHHYKHAFEIEKLATDENIKVNLFDYGSYITDKSDNNKVMNFVNANDDGTFIDTKGNTSNYVDDGVASKDYSGNNRPEMNMSLDANGYPVAKQLYCKNGFEDNNVTKTNSLQYLFDENMTYVDKNGSTTAGLSYADYIDGEYQSVRFGVGDGTSSGLFRKDEATNTYSYSGIDNAAYFDRTAFFPESNDYNFTSVFGETFQLYDYKIRPYNEWYNWEYEGNAEVEVLSEDSNRGYGYSDGNHDKHTISLGDLGEAYNKGSLNYDDNAIWTENSLMHYRGYAQNGEFMPFNLGHAMSPGSNPIKINLYDANGNLTGETWTDSKTNAEGDFRTSTNRYGSQYGRMIPAYYNDVNVESYDYGNTGNVKNTNNYTNMWFGLNFEFNFQQLNGGTVANESTGENDDMVFKFVGDDDVWVYIDDVLILDIGGIHAAYYGEINFKDGKAIHPVTNHNFHYEKYSIRDKYVEAYKAARNNIDSALYEELKILARNLNHELVSQITEEEIEDHLIKYDDADETGIFDANGIFLDESIHTLKFYYLERGAGVSTCNVSFNMAPIPTAVVDVEKQVVSSTDNTIDLSDRDDDEYEFEITGYKTNQGDNIQGESLEGEEYTYNVIDTKTDELLESNLKVKDGETFKLKGGQKAVFNMQIETNYVIKEKQNNNQRFSSSGYFNGEKLNFAEEYSVSTKNIIEGQTYDIDFVNALQPTTVTLKYYDRVIANGQPSDISSKATAFSYEFYGTEVEYDINNEISNSAELIQTAADKLNLNEIGNVLDEYILYTSNEEAKNDLKNNYINYHTGANYLETEYHTNHYGHTQDESGFFADGSKGDGEKWVNIGDDKITTWLFNTPKKYTVKTFGVVDATTAYALNPIGDGKYVNTTETSAKTTTAYYNQRMGKKPSSDSNTSNDTTNYLTQYGIDGYTGTTSTTDATATTYDGTAVNFLYWAFDKKGTQIASTDFDYNQRIASDTSIYAIYGAGTEKPDGITLRENGYDVYVDENSVSRVRLNSVLNPYGTFADSKKTNISDVAVLYVNLKDVADEKIADEVKNLESQLITILNNNENYEISGKSVNLSTVDSGTAKVNGFKYDVVAKADADTQSEVYLTSKNRVQFSTSFKVAQFKELRLIAVAAVCVDGEWTITDNFNDYNPTTYIK